MDTRVKPAYDEFEKGGCRHSMLIGPINIRNSPLRHFLIDVRALAQHP
jgi:hypothetical protein